MSEPRLPVDRQRFADFSDEALAEELQRRLMARRGPPNDAPPLRDGLDEAEAQKLLARLERRRRGGR